MTESSLQDYGARDISDTPDSDNPPQPQPTDVSRLFVIYNGYRMLVGLGLLSVLFIPATRQLAAGFDQSLFGIGAATLLATALLLVCLLYTSPSPRDKRQSRMPSSA